MVRWRLLSFSVFAPVILAACDPAPGDSSQTTSRDPAVAAPQADDTIPADAVVLSVNNVPLMLEQCSRSSEVDPVGYLPTATEILALEAALPGALEAAMAGRESWQQFSAGRPLQGWRRQYVGVIRDGRRFVCGNYFPERSAYDDTWTHIPLIVMDGGADYFGVEYDVAAQSITNLRFNGMA